MARTNNKECAVCHKIYSYCPDCAEYIHEPYWKNMFCSEQCLDTYDVLSRYVSGAVNKEWAKARLDNIGIEKKVLRGSFLKAFTEIMGEQQINDKEEKSVVDVEKKIAMGTKETVVSNMTAEAKAVYPKSVKNKKRY